MFHQYTVHRLIGEVLNDQNLFTESNLGDRFSSYVQFYSGGHFSERAATARWSGKVNHLKIVPLFAILTRNNLKTFTPEFLSISEYNSRKKGSACY